MTHRVDARGLSCPQPVVMTKRVLEKTRLGMKAKAPGEHEASDASGTPEVIEILVDNRTAMENVSRFARYSGCDVTIDNGDDNDCYVIRVCVKG
ncbi:MAG TPA: sulfurtransferase TusA family protein [Bacillota bacterium]|nr:sulfurtransferase TusA family protein [Bacillota bacterium]